MKVLTGNCVKATAMMEGDVSLTQPVLKILPCCELLAKFNSSTAATSLNITNLGEYEVAGISLMERTQILAF